MTATPAVPRPPQQSRTREGWDRILASGIELLEEGGWEALKIAEVCRRADVSPTAIYARVDGREGLFGAVYAHAMGEVRESERVQFGALAEPSSVDVARAVVAVFDLHESLLRAVIRRSSSSPELLARGAAESARLRGEIADRLGGSSATRESAARLVFSESVIRVMYGRDFYEPSGESADAFAGRIGAIVDAMIAAD